MIVTGDGRLMSMRSSSKVCIGVLGIGGARARKGEKRKVQSNECVVVGQSRTRVQARAFACAGVGR